MIHPQAVVDPGATLGDGVSVGAWSHIGAEVEIGNDTEIASHVVITGPSSIGARNKIYAFNAIGGDSQDKKYAGERVTLEIGDDNVIREFCTLNRGTVQGGGATRIGNDNWLMAYVHIAHDCTLGDGVVMANNASIAGHVTVGDQVTLGGFALVHQFCAIAAHSFIAMGSVVLKDVPPFLMVSGNPAKPHGLNSEGLKRRGFDDETIRWMRRGYKIVYKRGLALDQAIAELKTFERDCAEVSQLRVFIECSSRGIIR